MKHKREKKKLKCCSYHACKEKDCEHYTDKPKKNLVDYKTCEEFKND